jgi:WD40 repeat protein
MSNKQLFIQCLLNNGIHPLDATQIATIILSFSPSLLLKQEHSRKTIVETNFKGKILQHAVLAAIHTFTHHHHEEEEATTSSSSSTSSYPLAVKKISPTPFSHLHAPIIKERDFSFLFDYNPNIDDEVNRTYKQQLDDFKNNKEDIEAKHSRQIHIGKNFRISSLTFDLRGRLLVGTYLLQVWKVVPECKKMDTQKAGGLIRNITASSFDPDLFGTGTILYDDNFHPVGNTTVWRFDDDNSPVRRIHVFSKPSACIEFSSDAVAFIDAIDYSTTIHNLVDWTVRIKIPQLGPSPKSTIWYSLSLKFIQQDCLLLSLGWDLKVLQLIGKGSKYSTIHEIVPEYPHIMTVELQPKSIGGFFVGRGNGGIDLFNSKFERILARENVHGTYRVTALKRVNELLASGGEDGCIRVWFASTLELIAQFTNYAQGLPGFTFTLVGFHPQGSWIASCTREREPVLLYSAFVNENKEIQVFGN